MRKVEIQAVIGRSSLGDFQLRIEDGVSGLMILEARLTAEQFANVVTARHESVIPAEIYDEGAPHWGLHHREHREHRELIAEGFSRADENWRSGQARAREALAAEGFTLHEEERPNHHRYHLHEYQFSGSRWVDAEGHPVA